MENTNKTVEKAGESDVDATAPYTLPERRTSEDPSEYAPGLGDFVAEFAPVAPSVPPQCTGPFSDARDCPACAPRIRLDQLHTLATLDAYKLFARLARELNAEGFSAFKAGNYTAERRATDGYDMVIRASARL